MIRRLRNVLLGVSLACGALACTVVGSIKHNVVLAEMPVIVTGAVFITFIIYHLYRYVRFG